MLRRVKFSPRPAGSSADKAKNKVLVVIRCMGFNAKSRDGVLRGTEAPFYQPSNALPKFILIETVHKRHPSSSFTQPPRETQNNASAGRQLCQFRPVAAARRCSGKGPQTRTMQCLSMGWRRSVIPIVRWAERPIRIGSTVLSDESMVH